MKWQDFVVLPATLIAFFVGYSIRLPGPTVEVEKIVEKIVEVPGKTITIVKTEIEYVPITVTEPPVILMSESEPSAWIDPKTIPETRPWLFHGVDILQHLLDEHTVRLDQVVGWSNKDLHKLHSYVHNGGSL
jgi:hypothetical protein